MYGQCIMWIKFNHISYSLTIYINTLRLGNNIKELHDNVMVNF